MAYVGLPELRTSKTVVFIRRKSPSGEPNRLLKTLVSVSPSRALRTSSSKAMSHLANAARARALLREVRYLG